MKRETKIILVAIALLIIAGAGTGLYLFYMPTKNFVTSSADFKLSAKSFFEEFLKDQNSANAKYVTNNRTIQLAGKISEINKNPDGTATVTLETGYPDSDITCALTKEESVKAEKFKPGLNITVKGECTGFQELINKEVVMIRCGIID